MGRRGGSGAHTRTLWRRRGAQQRCTQSDTIQPAYHTLVQYLWISYSYADFASVRIQLSKEHCVCWRNSKHAPGFSGGSSLCRHAGSLSSPANTPCAAARVTASRSHDRRDSHSGGAPADAPALWQGVRARVHDRYYHRLCGSMKMTAPTAWWHCRCTRLLHADRRLKWRCVSTLYQCARSRSIHTGAACDSTQR
jgi:hypothetical protein